MAHYFTGIKKKKKKSVYGKCLKLIIFKNDKHLYSAE